MNSLIIIASLGIVIIILAFTLGAIHYKMFDAFINKAKSEIKTGETDIESLMARAERNIRASILSDEQFLTALAAKIKTIAGTDIKNI